ncbi:hypothetical protein ACJJTC_012747 [Scirpophaga incertulas]
MELSLLAEIADLESYFASDSQQCLTLLKSAFAASELFSRALTPWHKANSGVCVGAFERGGALSQHAGGAATNRAQYPTASAIHDDTFCTCAGGRSRSRYSDI